MENNIISIPSAQFPSLVHLGSGFVGLLVVVLASQVYAARRRNVNVPMIGKSSWLGSLIPAFDAPSLNACRSVLIEGSSRYPNGWFKMRLFPFGTTAVANGPALINELRNAPDDAFSFAEFADKVLQIGYTISPALKESRYHVPIVRTTLTRNLAGLFPDLLDEMNSAFKESIFNLDGLKEGEWRSIPVHRNIMELVCRTTNRLVVGAPLCRNKEYRDLIINFTIDVAKSSMFINLFPTFLHPIVGPILSKTNKTQRKMLRLAGPLIEERKAKLAADKNYADKPNDYLTWILEDAPPGFEQTTEGWVIRLLQMNFAAIHTSSTTFTHAIFHLATQPEYMAVLREEIDAVIESDGWSKASMQKMKRLDSFLRESSRLNAIILTSLNRFALRDYTFQDGTFIPKGNFVTASLYSLHMDDENYEDAKVFKPWRFVEMRETGDEGESVKHQFTNTSVEYLAFGLGKHACPGRFFAANEIKAMMCYLVQNFDVKLPDGITERPMNQYFGTSVTPNQTAEVMFSRRKRVC